MKKRVWSLLLCVLLLLPTTVLAQTFTEGYFYYEVVDGSITITGYFGRESEVTVPPSIAGLPVSTIAGGAFSDSQSVGKVNLPDTIMKIEGGAFGQSQSIVYNSNTDTPVTREPQSTQSPSGGGSGGSLSGGTGTGGTPSGGSGTTPAPTPTAAPGGSGANVGTVSPSATPGQSAAPAQTPAPGDDMDELPPLPTPVNPEESPKQTNGGTESGQPEASKEPGAAAATQQPGATDAPSQGGTPAAGDGEPIDEEVPTAGFEVSELLEDGTVEVVQSATTMPTPTPAPKAEKDKELIVTLGGESGGMKPGALVGVIALVLVVLAAAACAVVLVLRKRRNDAN